MNALLEIKNLVVRTEDKRTLVSDFSLTVKPGDLVLIDGPNGAGKTTLLRAILEKHFRRGDAAYLPQLANMKFLLPLNLGEVAVLKGQIGEGDLLPSASKDLAWNSASGGERQKTLLDALFSSGASLFILDEPFNHLDSSSRLKVLGKIKALMAQGCAFLIVSHEALELQRIVTQVIHVGENNDSH